MISEYAVNQDDARCECIGADANRARTPFRPHRPSQLCTLPVCGHCPALRDAVEEQHPSHSPRAESQRVGRHLFLEACERDLEGIVGKWAYATYQTDTRRTSWLKIKNPD